MKKATVRSLTAKGYSQYKIAKILKIRKSKVVLAQKQLKIGVRRENEFWKDVETVRRLEENTWKQARKMVFNDPYWARKRAARQSKKYKSYSDFWREWKEKWRDASEKERDEHGYEATYGDEGEYVGGTPH